LKDDGIDVTTNLLHTLPLTHLEGNLEIGRVDGKCPWINTILGWRGNVRSRVEVGHGAKAKDRVGDTTLWENHELQSPT